MLEKDFAEYNSLFSLRLFFVRFFPAALSWLATGPAVDFQAAAL
jgi:hypothetical protein